MDNRNGSRMAHINGSCCCRSCLQGSYHGKKIDSGLVFLREIASLNVAISPLWEFLTCTQGCSLNKLPEFGWTSQKNLHCGSPLHMSWVPPLQSCYLHLSKDNSLWQVPAGLESTACRALISARGLQEEQRLLSSLGNEIANLRYWEIITLPTGRRLPLKYLKPNTL